MPLLGDEPTRAVVALEMAYSGNWWVPTITGEYYYRKPPVYNWILASLFKLTGNTSELMVRLPAVVPLFLYGGTIYLWAKKYLDKKIAFLGAIMFITCGRMVVYSSMLGYIDIVYSWVTFVSFIAIWEFYQRKQWLLLFVVSYLLSAAAFLMKGLPTVLFQGISLTAFFFFQKEFKRLFTWQHLIGIALFLVLVVGYFWKYSQYNELYGWVAELWDQSEQRTVLRKAWYESIAYLFMFPFDQAIHLAPWSLLAVFCFRRGYLIEVWQTPFLRFIAIILLANIPVYWLSPGNRPRYMFMLYPLLLILISYAYFTGKEKLPVLKKWVESIYLVLGALVALAVWGVFAFELEIPLKALKIAGLFVAFALVLWAYYKLAEYRFITFTIVILLFRIGFDWFTLPYRFQTSTEDFYKQECIRIAERSSDKPITVMKGSAFSHLETFYFETVRNEIVRYGSEPHKGYKLTRLENFASEKCSPIDTMKVKYQDRTVYLYQCQE